MEGTRQNVSNRELLQPFYLHPACNGLQLWGIGTNVGGGETWQEDADMRTGEFFRMNDEALHAITTGITQACRRCVDPRKQV